MKIIVDILIKDIDPVIYNHDRAIVTRYFWSSLDNVKIIFLHLNLMNFSFYFFYL